MLGVSQKGHRPLKVNELANAYCNVRVRMYLSNVDLCKNRTKQRK